jgi:hypothetical protein
VDYIFGSPIITIPGAQKALGVTYHSAKNDVDRLVRAGILQELPTETRPRFFIAGSILDVLYRKQASP